MRNLLLLSGLVLLPLGAAAPALVPARPVVIALVDLGQDGADPLLTLHEAKTAVRPPVDVRALTPGLVELRAPAGHRADVDVAVAALSRPARTPVACDGFSPTCLDGLLQTQPLVCRPSGLVDAVVETRLPASRS